MIIRLEFSPYIGSNFVFVDLVASPLDPAGSLSDLTGFLRERKGPRGSTTMGMASLQSDVKENPQGIDLGAEAVSGPLSNQWKINGNCLKLRTYVLLDASLVDKNVNFPNNWKVLVCMICRASGNVKDFLKPLFSILEPLKLFKLNQTNTQSVLSNLCFSLSELWKLEN